MLKYLGLISLAAGLLAGCNLVPRKAAIEILSSPNAKVYLDGKEVGLTPYKNTTLVPGEIGVRLVAGEDEWKKVAPLVNNANTVVNWEFGSKGQGGGGYVLSVESTGDKSKAGLLVNSRPQNAAVAIDGEIKALTPVVIPDLGEGDKQVTVSFPTYKTINLFVKSLRGYQLILEVELKNSQEAENRVAPSPTISTGKDGVVIIGETETGWLRVREEPSNTSAEVDRVYPGEKYPLLGEQEGWYRIKQGWISTKYADKSE